MRKQTQKFWKLKVEYTSALPEKNTQFNVTEIVLEIRSTVRQLWKRSLVH